MWHVNINILLTSYPCSMSHNNVTMLNYTYLHTSIFAGQIIIWNGFSKAFSLCHTAKLGGRNINRPSFE